MSGKNSLGQMNNSPQFMNPMGPSHHNPNSKYSWNGVMDFLQEQLRSSHIKENEWIIEKKQLEERLIYTEQQLKQKDQEIAMLKKKVKYLEFNMQQEKKNHKAASSHPGHSRVKSDFVSNLLNSQGEKIIATTSNSITSSIIYSGGDKKGLKQFLNQTGLGHVYPSGTSDSSERQKVSHHRHCHSYGGSTNKNFYNTLGNHNNNTHYGDSNVKRPDEHAKHNTSLSQLSPPGFHGGHFADRTQDENYNPQATFNPANNSLLFNPLNNSLLGNNSFNNSYMGSPSFVGPSSNNNSFAVNQSHLNYTTSSNILYPDNQPQLSQGNQTDSSNESKPKISTNITNSKPSLTPNITPAQKYSIVENKTAKRRWLNENATNPEEVVYPQPHSELRNDLKKMHNSTASVIPANFDKGSKVKTPTVQSKNSLNDSIEDTQIGKKYMQPRCALRSHFDGIRDVFFTAMEPILATVSEDCMVKLWDVRKFAQSNDSTHLEPYYTFRYHAGPLFTITGNQQGDVISPYNLLFTGGSEGVIRVWSPPHPDEVNCYGPCGNKNYCVSLWNAHLDVIWELKHHPRENLLLSSSSDGTIKIWETLQEDENESLKISNGNILGTLCYKNMNFQQLDTPTSVAWIYQKLDGIVSGYVNSSHLVYFDRDQGKIISTPQFMDEEVYTPESQVNKVAWSPEISCLATGHEDRNIRFFDLHSGELVNSVIAHTDAVTGLSFSKNIYHLASVGHDGSIRTWDTRKFQCVHEIPAHKKKYDEAIHTIMYHPTMNYAATGGADGIVKIFQCFE